MSRRRRSVFSDRESGGFGGRLLRVALILGLLVVVGGTVALGLYDVEPPSREVVRPVFPDVLTR